MKWFSIRKTIGTMVLALVASLLMPSESNAKSYASSACYTPSYSYCYTPSYSYCYTPCYTYCYTPCYYPPCPPKEYCVVLWYDYCRCCYVIDSYPPDDKGAAERVAYLKTKGYYAYYCCYEFSYPVYKYDAAKCCWVYVQTFPKGQEDAAKAKVTELMKDGPAYYFPCLVAKCVP